MQRAPHGALVVFRDCGLDETRSASAAAVIRLSV
jgi:hypothetical protein